MLGSDTSPGSRDRAELIRALVRRRKSMDAEYNMWEPHFRELRDAIQPSRGRFSLGEDRRSSTLNKKIIDGQAQKSLRTMRAGLMAGMTSPSRAWFKLGLYDQDAMEDPETQAYLHTVQTRMYTVLRGSNIYRVLDAAYGDLGLYGTFCGLIVDDYEDVIHGYHLPVGLFRIEENDRGVVDVIHRDVRKTVAQVVEMFGIENCSTQVQNLYKQNQLYDWVDIHHAIEVRRDRDPMSPLSINKPFASYYWEKTESSKFLNISGYDVNPILAPRWERVEGETWSVSSPAMIALGDAVQLQQQHRDKAIAIQYMVKPPLMGPAGFTQRFKHVPGGITTLNVTDLQKGGLRPTHEVKPDVAALVMDINETRERIRQAFFEDLFLMTAESDRRQVTAREIAERHEEKLLVLGPVLESLDHGLLQPIIEATYHYMEQAGILPEPPEAIQGRPLKVEYISLLAQAQRAVGVAAIERTVGFAGSLAQVRPDVLDGLNADAALREFASQIGPPPELLHDQKTIDAIRQERAQQAQQQALMENAQPLAQAANLISETAERGERGLQNQQRVV